jgi:hypothetical protein
LAQAQAWLFDIFLTCPQTKKMKHGFSIVFLLFSWTPACHGAATPTKEHTVLMAINPPLKDVASDKKFFGPPFPADYPEDKRPRIDRSILDSIKSPDQPYPALQSREDYDRDFVKDENSDTGAWKAQFEYDAARKRLMDEESGDKRAQDSANRASQDESDAQRNADDAGRKATDAQKGVDDARAGEHSTDQDDGDDTHDDGHETLEELKRKVKEAEDKYEQAKKSFAECERQLKEAKAEFERLQAELEAMEKKAYSAQALWAQQKTVRMTALKAKKDAEKAAAAAKTKAARDNLAKVQAKKAAADKKLAKEKSQHEMTLKDLQKQKADMERTKNGLEEARLRLQKLRGVHIPAHGAARSSTVVSALLVAAATYLF